MKASVDEKVAAGVDSEMRKIPMICCACVFYPLQTSNTKWVQGCLILTSEGDIFLQSASWLFVVQLPWDAFSLLRSGVSISLLTRWISPSLNNPQSFSLCFEQLWACLSATRLLHVDVKRAWHASCIASDNSIVGVEICKGLCDAIIKNLICTVAASKITALQITMCH